MKFFVSRFAIFKFRDRFPIRIILIRNISMAPREYSNVGIALGYISQTLDHGAAPSAV